jgi:hypothetical protein
MKNTKKPQLFKVAAPKLKVKTIGYINLMARNKAEIGRKGTPKLYRSKITLRAAKVAQKLKDKANKLFNQCFAQAALLEARVLEAKRQLQEARKHILSTLEYFALHCNLARTAKRVRDYKFSLPQFIKVQLF